MTRGWILSVIVLAAAGFVSPLPASARGHHYGGWRDRYENRRDARRAGVVAGIAAAAIAGAAASSRADERDRECRAANGGYDDVCARLRYEDDLRARRNARRAGVAAGAAAYAIVRD